MQAVVAELERKDLKDTLQSPPRNGPFTVLPQCWLLPLFSTYAGPSDYILPEDDANSSSSLCPRQKPSTKGPGELARLPWVVLSFQSQYLGHAGALVCSRITALGLAYRKE